MVIEQKQTHIAYHCSHCGTAVLGYVGEFALSADMLKLKCDCGKSELTVTYTNDKKIRLTVPCLFCENPHHFVVTQKVFFEKDLFLLGCPYTGVDVCFMGKTEALQKALDQSAKELNELFEQNGMTLPANASEEGVDEEGEKEIFPDEQIYDIIHFLVRDLEAEGGVHCPCGKGPYETEIVAGGIHVFCAECGAERLFPTVSVTQAQDFLYADSIELLPKNK